MQRGKYITDDPTILIQMNDHTLLEARGRYITETPLFAYILPRKEKRKKREEKSKRR